MICRAPHVQTQHVATPLLGMMDASCHRPKQAMQTPIGTQHVGTQNVACLHVARPCDAHARIAHHHGYRRKHGGTTTRRMGWDYGSDAAYFITICTQHRTPSFGTINRDAPATGIAIDHTRMQLTDIGCTARDCWLAIPRHFPFVTLDAFVIMPDHLHGILELHRADGKGQWQTNQFGPQSMNLASVVRGFKIGVTTFARIHAVHFQWQPRYHDHVIRNGEERIRIRTYIERNPFLWAQEQR